MKNQQSIRPQEYQQHEVLEEVMEQENHHLVVFNDDFNTFDYVIATLVEVCGHEAEQAEQCAVIIHYKGKCSVKTGETILLDAMCQEICRRGIDARIN